MENAQEKSQEYNLRREQVRWFEMANDKLICAPTPFIKQIQGSWPDIMALLTAIRFFIYRLYLL